MTENNNINAIKSEESIAFDMTFERFIKDIIPTKPPEKLKEVYIWLNRVLEYNVPHEKHIRGLAVVSTFQLMAEHENRVITEEDLELSRVLGWAVELLRTYCLVVDEIKDESVTRNGQLCWYRLKEVGPKAHNDVLLIDQSIYYILRKYFSDKKYYLKLVELMHEISLLTSMGQCMDTASNQPNTSPQFELFTQSRYETICEHKTAFYTMVLPVRLAMYLFGMNSDVEHKNAEKILLQIGILYQINDDFMDCFVDPIISGKVGTDIEEGKCCWPVVTALKLCNDSQRQTIESNYGNKDEECVRRVKSVYNELNLRDVYSSEEELHYKHILESIDDLKTKSSLNSEIFTYLLNIIYRRNK